ncbi:MAG: methyltransferase domain-containing protein [Candidatus Alcyoniella australis]|nr:methyltransferase domain-containing protein [Candidatus Alcyoniella australis]
MSPIPKGNTALIEQYRRQLEYSRGGRLHVYRMVGIGNLERVLDVGCGGGAVTAELNRSCRGSAVGCDVDPQVLQIAVQEYPALRFEQCAPDALPFDDSEFDLVCAHLTLMWADDPAQLIAQMRRVTRSGGWVAALAEPDYGAGLYNPGDWLIGEAERELVRQGADPRIGRKLPELFKDAGFERVIRGVVQSAWDEQRTREHAAAEIESVRTLLGGKGPEREQLLDQWAGQFAQAAQEGRATVFMPLFFAAGRK